jgi:hypothetical protein
VYPEDRVLVGVINRKRDFEKAQYEHWYRVPQGKAPKGIHAEYIAFFMSRAFKELNGGIHYYARRTGVELARRRDLLPEEANHPRSDALYHKLQFGDLRRKEPPILNASKRRVSFIYTTWDRFSQANVIADLYSDADHFVDRVFHVLEKTGMPVERVWEAEQANADGGAQLQILCEQGPVIASTGPRTERVIPLPVDKSSWAVQTSVEAILRAVEEYGGPLMIDVPIEE